VQIIQSRQTAVLPVLVLLMLSSMGMNAQVQGQAGGGSLPNDPMGGAAMIFRKPENPPLHTGSSASAGAAGGGRISRPARTRTPAKPVATKAAAHEQVIARGNAARSAPTPRYSEAERQYKIAAAEEPTDARAYAGLGNTYLDQERFSDAVIAYRQALKVSPDYLPVYQPLAFSLVRLGRYAEAADTLKQALAYDPKNPEIYNNLGFAYVHAGNYTDAITACQEAIALLGKTGEAFRQELQNRNEVLSNSYKNLGNAYNELKQYNEAADALKHATEIEPKNAAAHFNLGLALYNGGRFPEAIGAYQEVIKLRPELAGAHFNLGLAYIAINDKDAARREYALLKPLNTAMAEQLRSLIK